MDAGQRLKEPQEIMSAAATAAGYLYASGRLRGRNGRDDEVQEPEQKQKPRRKEVKVAVYPPPAPEAPPKPLEARAKPAPKIQYRTRRWKPE
jgi:hypothetical protein